MTAQLKQFSERHEMIAALAVLIIQRLREAIEQHGVASLIVSGGSTPKKLFDILSKQTLDWSKVTISLADERWVDTSSPDSNEYLVRNSLLVNKVAVAAFVPLKTLDATPELGVVKLQEVINKIPVPFDVLVLGMGDDGHTASLFPYANDLAVGLDLNNIQKVMALTPKELPAHAPYPRISMTLSGILNSRLIVMLLAGQSKLDVYKQALAGEDTQEMPVRAVLKQTHTPVITYWAP